MKLFGPVLSSDWLSQAVKYLMSICDSIACHLLMHTCCLKAIRPLVLLMCHLENTHTRTIWLCVNHVPLDGSFTMI